MAEIRATPQQRAAAEDRGGALLVAAAAGSGKTKVLVDRLMGYLTDPTDPADLDEFLIITYTRAAASELRGKIAARIAEALAGTPNDRHLQRQLTRVYLAQISTVHSFCQAVLRQYAAEANLPADFRVADEQQAAALRAQTLRDVLSELYAKLDDEPDFAAMIDTLGYGRDDRRLLELAERSYEVMRCKVDPEAWMADCLRAEKRGRSPRFSCSRSFLSSRLRCTTCRWLRCGIRRRCVSFWGLRFCCWIFSGSKRGTRHCG